MILDLKKLLFFESKKILSFVMRNISLVGMMIGCFTFFLNIFISKTFNLISIIFLNINIIG